MPLRSRRLRRSTWSTLLGVQIAAAAMVTTEAVAQRSPSAQDQSVPQLSLSGTADVRTLGQWPGISLTVDRDAFVAVFAVTRGRREYPLQVLAPQNPSAKGFVKRGERLRVRRLAKDEMLHLVNWGEAPVVVAFASTVRPDLSAFMGGRNQWGRDLLLDTAATSQQALVEILGKSIFGANVPYDAVVSSASSPTPLSRYADVWSFDNDCLGQTARWTRFAGSAGYGLYSWMDIDPIVRVAMGLGSIFLPWGWSSGLPITLFSGVGQIPSQYSIVPMNPTGRCLEYRVVWWPQMVYPTVAQRPNSPVDSTQIGGPEALPSPVPRVPRYPTAGTGLEIDPLAAARADRDLVNPVYRSTAVGSDEPSAWRRGETPSARRFPAVTTEDRPWSRPGSMETRTYVPNDPQLPTTGRYDRESARTQGVEPPRSSAPMAEERSRQGVPSAPVAPPSPPVERDVKPSYPSGGSTPPPSPPPPPPPPASPPPTVPPPSGPGGPIIPPLS